MKLILILTTLLMVMPVVPLPAIDNTTLTYGEATGSDHEEVYYALSSRGDLIYIKTDSTDEHYKIVTDDNLCTIKLEIEFGKNSDTITIHKEDDRFVIKGTENRSIQVDPEIPWYQSLICLKEFSLSKDRKRSFYSLSSHFDERLSKGKGIQVLRFIAKKEGKETVEVDGKTVEAWRVMVTFDDIRSLFWKAYYWYRTHDGLLVMYKEIRGGPGTPETLGTLIREEHTYE